MSEPDRMRQRLRELGRSADRELAPELDARIVEHVKLHGPTVVRRSRQRRALVRASMLVVPFALGVFGWRAWEERAAEPVAQRSVPGALAPSEGSANEARADSEVRLETPSAACAQRAVERSTFLGSTAGRRVLDLADRGRAVLEQGAEATLDASDPCRLALQLERGRVTVHAKNLWGGELLVKAGGADVVVHGTTFAVERAADDVTVAVAEGAVAVEREGHAVAPLVRGGQRLQVSATRAPVLLALSEAESVQLRAAVSETVVLAKSSAAGEGSPSSAPNSVAPADRRGVVEHAGEEGPRTRRDAPQNRGGAASRAVRRASAPADEAVAERSPQGHSRASASPSRSASRFAAAQPSAQWAAESGDSESPPSADEASAGSARAIGSAAWQRALADSSAPARAASPTSAGTREPANASSPSARPSADAVPAAKDASAAAPNELPRSEAPAPAKPLAATEDNPASVETATPARAETPAELVARADALWRWGSRDDARALYRRAGSASGATAQAAWLALARRELAAGRASAAREALDGYLARFQMGALAEEAAGIEFRIALLEHDDARTERSAKRLRERYPDSPAAKAAARWLRTRGPTP